MAIELTPEEEANGWTVPTLTAYLAERERAQAGIVMFSPEHRPRQRPRWANSLYDPMSWRGK